MPKVNLVELLEASTPEGLSALPDGAYIARLYGGSEVRVDKVNGIWFFADGTGWRHKVEFQEEIVYAKEIKSSLPSIEKTYNYGPLTYPLTDYFKPRKEADAEG